MQTTNIHPALTALETAMAKMSSAQGQIEQGSRWADQTSAAVDPASWTQKIEAALGKPEELERLRVLYDEKALSFMSAFLRQGTGYRHLFDACTLICDGIRDVLVAHDAIDDRSQEKWLKGIMQTRVIEASELHRKPRPDSRIDGHSPIMGRIYGILVDAFSTLATGVLAQGPRRNYTTDLVVQGRKYESFLNPDVDLRGVYMVDFVDCVNSTHPASQKLAQLFAPLEEALKAARLAESRLKGGQNQYDANYSAINNGTINERQHANRLMDAIHGQTGCSSMVAQVEAQTLRRRQYEGVRQEVLIASHKLRELYEQLVETLHAAVAETQQLLGETRQDQITTVDRWDTLRICMNNCLAVDLYLRAVGRELQNLQSLYNRDLSQGAGAQAVASQFADLAKSYRPFASVTQPRPEAAS